MKLIRNSLAAGIAFGALTVAACSSQHGATGSNSNGSEPGTSVGVNSGAEGSFGKVGMHLNIGTPPNNASVTQLNWVISNGINTYPGTTVVGDAQSFEFVQGGIVAGTGYTVTLTGSDSNGDPCSGTSASFSILAGQVTQVTLGVTCTVPNDASTLADVNTGTVEVDAAVTQVIAPPTACPGIGSFSISPAEIAPGQTAALTLVSVGPASTITWSVSPAGSGSFGSTSSASTTFTCTAPTAAGFAPQVTVTATVGLPDSGACTGATFTTQSALVNCEGIAVPPICPDPALPTNCGTDAAPSCVNTSTDANNCGTCGHACGTGSTCSGGSCTTPPPTCSAICPASDTTNCSNALTTGIGYNATTMTGCNGTESLLSAHSATCLECALNSSCLHDNQGDNPSSATNPTFDCEDATGNDSVDAGSTRTQACLSLLSCDLTSKCAAAGGALDCYCGVGVSSSACLTAQSGACIPQVQFGLESTSPSFIESNITATAGGTGGAIAGAIMQCLHNNCSASCF